ncbi:MAG: hypothetical protein FWC40_04660 [Proteobacteria bacterium]|nr:hypothetical protein [Pseudomonadota bacterium]
MTLDKQLGRMIRRARRRLWARRLVRWSTRLLSVSLGVGAVLVLIHGFLGVGCVWCWCLVALPWVAGGIAAWPWKLPAIEIVKAIDLANGLDERLSSAWDFLNRKEPTPWMQAHLKDTASRLDDTRERDFGRRTFPIEKPGHWAYVGWGALLLVASAAGLHLIDKYGVDKKISSLPPDVIEPVAAKSNLDEVSLALREEQARGLQALAQTLDDPDLKQAADMLAEILADEAQGKLSAEEFEARLAALEAMLDKSAPAPREEQQKLDEIIRNAVQEFTQMKEDPDTRELAQALEESNYDKAADILKSLLDSLAPKDQKKLEKLAKMFADLAKKLDMTDPELKAAIKKNQDLVDRLKEQFEKTNKLTDEEKRAFDEASKRFEADRQRAEAQKSADKTAQALDRIQKGLEKTAKDITPKAQDPNAQAQSGSTQEVPGGDEQGQLQERPDANAQEPSGQPSDTDAQKPSGTPAEGSEQMGTDDKQMGAEEALREEARDRAKQDAQEAMRDLTDKMRRDAEEHKGGDKDNEKSKERSENMEDFLERAKGGQKKESPQPTPDSEQGQKQDGKPGQEQQSGQEQNQDQQGGKPGQEQQGSQAQSQDQSGQEQQGSQEKQDQQGDQSSQSQQSGQQGGQEQQGSQDQQSGKQSGQAEGQQGGDTHMGQGAMGHQGGHDPSEGPATELDVRTRDERLEGMQGAAPTTSEVIREASQSGFVTESYREVFQTYERAAEDVLEQEQVPQGYRQYVERYFDMIRPK